MNIWSEFMWISSESLCFTSYIYIDGSKNEVDQ